MYEAYISNPTKGEELEERASVKRKWHREDNNCYLTTPHNSITQIRETKENSYSHIFCQLLTAFYYVLKQKMILAQSLSTIIKISSEIRS